VDVEFIATISVIAADPTESRKLYVDALGLPLRAEQGSEYFHSETIGGAKHFSVWPLSQAAEACFGSPEWPAERPVPQMSIEFEVADADAVGAAVAELRAPPRSPRRAMGSNSRAPADRRFADRRHLLRALAPRLTPTLLSNQRPSA
jgi:hypothetical protein